MNRYNLWRISALIVAFCLGLLPQFGIVLCVGYGLAAVISQRVQWRHRTWWLAIVAYALLRIPWHTGNWGAAMLYWSLEIGFTISVLFGAAALRNQFSKWFALSTAIGALIAVTAAALPIWSFTLPTQSWYMPSSLANFTSDRGVDKLIPLDKNDAWIYRDLGAQGSGEIEYRFELKSEKFAKVAVWFQRSDLADDSYPQTCLADNTRWRLCSVHAKFTQRMRTVFVIGTWGTWKSSNGILEFRNAEMRILRQPTWRERLFQSTRAVGWSFNENGFGVWMACIAALIFISSGRVSKVWLSALPCVLGVCISGSRNALIALLLTCILLIVLQVRSGVLKLAVTLSIALIAIGISIIIDVRDLHNINFLKNNERLEIYRIAWDLVLQSPWIGRGDFAQTLREYTTTLANGAVNHAHNLWLQTFGESGFLGIISLTTLFIIAVYHIHRTQDKTMTVILIMLVFNNSVDYFLYYSPVFFLFWLTFTYRKLEKPEILKGL